MSAIGEIVASAAVVTDQLVFHQSTEVKVESNRGPPQETEAAEKLRADVKAHVL
jgi:hypothetical protein